MAFPVRRVDKSAVSSRRPGSARSTHLSNIRRLQRPQWTFSDGSAAAAAQVRRWDWTCPCERLVGSGVHDGIKSLRARTRALLATMYEDVSGACRGGATPEMRPESAALEFVVGTGDCLFFVALGQAKINIPISQM